MTQKELREAMKIRPWLKQIDHILGKSATPAQKMELFVMVQQVAEQVMRRTLNDLTRSVSTTVPTADGCRACGAPANHPSGLCGDCLRG